MSQFLLFILWIEMDNKAIMKVLVLLLIIATSLVNGQGLNLRPARRRQQNRNPENRQNRQNTPRRRPGKYVTTYLKLR